ncbi:MAG: hypothetical protein QOD72_1998, partial [Acidimicrobiaceae bacterium]|nr:hypothetical protein [Acidimicrobiaceae bacterium]
MSGAWVLRRLTAGPDALVSGCGWGDAQTDDSLLRAAFGDDAACLHLLDEALRYANPPRHD